MVAAGKVLTVAEAVSDGVCFLANTCGVKALIILLIHYTQSMVCRVSREQPSNQSNGLWKKKWVQKLKSVSRSVIPQLMGIQMVGGTWVRTRVGKVTMEMQQASHSLELIIIIIHHLPPSTTIHHPSSTIHHLSVIYYHWGEKGVRTSVWIFKMRPSLKRRLGSVFILHTRPHCKPWDISRLWLPTTWQLHSNGETNRKYGK